MWVTSVRPGGRCATADVDLEALAAGYRHRPPSDAAMSHASAAVRGIARGSWTVDVGGGRGEHAALWASEGYRSLTVDPGEAMATSASTRVGVTALRGRAQALPLRNGSVSLIYFHLSIHYGDWNDSIAEAARVLRNGGDCVVWTLGAEHHRTSMLAKWFPSVAEIDSARFPEPGVIAGLLEKEGFDVAAGKEVEHVVRKAADWVAAVKAGFVSTLQLLTRAELESGLEAFHAAHADPAESISYDLRWDWIRGRRPN